MALRRYTELKPSMGTTWPPDVAKRIRERDRGCVGERAGFPEFVTHLCRVSTFPSEIDHVRASHGMGMKSRSTEDNGVQLGSPCHRWKTENGKRARAMLLDYLAHFYPRDEP